LWHLSSCYHFFKLLLFHVYFAVKTLSRRFVIAMVNLYASCVLLNIYISICPVFYVVVFYILCFILCKGCVYSVMNAMKISLRKDWTFITGKPVQCWLAVLSVKLCVFFTVICFVVVQDRIYLNYLCEIFNSVILPIYGKIPVLCLQFHLLHP